MYICCNNIHTCNVCGSCKQHGYMCLFSGLGIALGVTSLVAVIMTGVTTVLCYKLSSIPKQKLVQYSKHSQTPAQLKCIITCSRDFYPHGNHWSIVALNCPHALRPPSSQWTPVIKQEDGPVKLFSASCIRYVKLIPILSLLKWGASVTPQSS